MTAVVVDPERPLVATTRERQDASRPPASADGSPPRLRSLDVLRGLAIAAMLLVDNPGVRGAHPTQLVHSPWNGLRFADVVFPVFLVAVGVAMPFSRRAAAPRLAARRVVALVGLSMVLHLLKYGNLSPTGVLQHIAGSYAVAWLVLLLRPRAQFVATALLLAGAWAAYTWISGDGIVAGSWAPGSTPGAYLDRLVYGAPQTEGVVPMILGAVDMLAGAFVGRALRRRTNPAARRRVLAASAAAWTSAGLLLAFATPLNKRLWTPSYAVLTGGIALVALLAVHELTDTGRRARWVQPLRELGTNAIAVFVASQLFTILALSAVAPVVTRPIVPLVGPAAASAGFAVLVVTAAAALARVMWRRGWFIKV